MSSTVEAKAICIKHLEDILIDPMFTIFHVQHKQIEARTDSDTDLIHHFKNSMSKVKTWNSNIVKDFCSSLPIRFPQLTDLQRLFSELQDITCNILNESSISNNYTPVREEIHHVLHEFVSACSDSFIGNIEWFSVDENSPEFQSYKNTAKQVIQQTNMVENVAMSFIKAQPKDSEDDKNNSDSSDSDSDSDGSNSDSDKDEDEETKDENKEGEDDQENEKFESKHIDLETGTSYGGDNTDVTGKFSTFIDEDKKSNASTSSKSRKSDSSKNGSESDSSKRGSESDLSKSGSESDSSKSGSESDSSQSGSESDSSDESLSESDESDESSDDNSESDSESSVSSISDTSGESEISETSDSESDTDTDDSDTETDSSESGSNNDSYSSGSSGYDTDTDDESLDSDSDMDISIISYSDDSDDSDSSISSY